MTPETLFAQIIHEAPSAAGKETPLLPVCSICGFIRDETGPVLDHERWVTQRTYQRVHGVNLDDCLLTHTYCAECFSRLMARIKAA